MSQSYKNAVDAACVRLLEETEIVQNIDLPYARAYMNYVLAWKYYLPVRTVIIGQNPYPTDVYPDMGAALSYDPAKKESPPRSVTALAEDLYAYNKTPMSSTIRCMRDSWSLLHNGTILINETILSKIYPRMKSNRRPIVEMEEQCIALQIVLTASYFLGTSKFTIICMGERAKLMGEQLKKWCPSDVMSMKVLSCVNPAARMSGDMASHGFTLSQQSASKLLALEVDWYVNMSQKKGNFHTNRVRETEKSLMESIQNVLSTKNEMKTEIDSLLSRMEADQDTGAMDKYKTSLQSMRKATIAYTNSIKSNQMQFIQYVNASMAAMPQGQQASESASNSPHKDVAKLAAVNPPRKKTQMAVESIASESTVPNIAEGLQSTPAIRVEARTPKSTRVAMKVSSVAPSAAGTDVAATQADAPPKKKRSIKSVNAMESVHITAFADWFRIHFPEDATYAGILQTVSEDKHVGDTKFAAGVMKYIRERKKADPEYDSNAELRKEESDSFKWALSKKTELLEGQ